MLGTCLAVQCNPQALLEIRAKSTICATGGPWARATYTICTILFLKWLGFVAAEARALDENRRRWVLKNYKDFWFVLVGNRIRMFFMWLITQTLVGILDMCRHFEEYSQTNIERNLLGNKIIVKSIKSSSFYSGISSTYNPHHIPISQPIKTITYIACKLYSRT